MMKKDDVERIEIDDKKLKELEGQLKSGEISSENIELILKMFEWVKGVDTLLKMKDLSMKRLRRLIFGNKSERQDHNKKDKQKNKNESQGEPKTESKDSKRVIAEVEQHRHEELKSGDSCPQCQKGKLYDYRPKIILSYRGEMPVQVKKHVCHGLRCALCGELFYPTITHELEKKRYASSLSAMLAIMRYNLGVPSNRLGHFQDKMGVPLPKSTQWDLLSKLAGPLYPVFGKLIEFAANGKLIYNDDTTIKIQDHFKDGRKKSYCTSIYSKGERQITLYLSGKKHAGKNMKDLLSKRADAIGLPITMNDGTGHVNLKGIALEANCLTHARRQFKDIEDRYERESAFVIREIGKIYHNDSKTKEMSEVERLHYHKRMSTRPLKRLRRWFYKMISEKKVEPNGPVGIAINYFLKNWCELTLFMSVAGVPLDNNLCEREVKVPIRHRKNSLFYKSEIGALVGDIYMSLIRTCLNEKIDPYKYLTNVGENMSRVYKNPASWMPWNYQTALAT